MGGGGWVKRGVGRRRGQMGSRRWAKATFSTQTTVLCLQYLTCTDSILRVGQDCHQEQFGTPCSPMNSPQDRRMHPCGSAASAKSRV